MSYKSDETANYKAVAVSTVSVTIEKATYDMSGVAFTSIQFTYDGQEHEVMITGTLPAGVTVAYQGNKLTLPGTSTATATFTGDAVNYNAIPSKTAEIKIVCADIDATVTPFSGTYDGSSHGILVAVSTAGATVTYSTTASGTYTPDLPTFIDAGTYTTWYKINATGYNELTGSATVTILKRAITVTSADASKTYDGTPLTADSATVSDGTLVTGHVMTATVTGTITSYIEGGASNTIASVTIRSGDVDVTSNYEITNDPGTLTINKKAVTVSPVSASVTYDGTLKSATYTVTGLVGTDSIDAVLAYMLGGEAASPVDAGEYSVSVSSYSFTKGSASNYAVTTGTATLTIAPASVQIPAGDSRSFIYNGQTQTYVIEISNLYAVTGNEQTDAGSYDITVSLKDKSNYRWSDASADDKVYSFIISPKALTVTSLSDTKVYMEMRDSRTWQPCL